MSFGGEYLFPEAWRKINDTPVDGQLSKTEKIKRGQVQFHQKNFPKVTALPSPFSGHSSTEG